MPDVSRRNLIRGAIAGLTGAQLLRPGEARAEDATEAPPVSEGVLVKTSVNGEDHELRADPDALAVHTLRHDLGKTGTKLCCGAGTCGACTVLVDGQPHVSCLLPTTALHGSEVTTIEGIAATHPSGVHPVQRAFLAQDALQCGYCTPGFVVEAAAFHDAWRAERGTETPSHDDVQAALAGHLCRCGAYPSITAAVVAACEGKHDEGPLAGPRKDGPEKVTGEATYTVDVQLEGQLVGAAVRSPYAHARILSFDVAHAASLPGVKAVVRLVPDQGIVRYVGQEVAAIAAVDEVHLHSALASLRVEYRVLPAIVDPEVAREPGAPLVYADKKAGKRAPSAAEGPVLGAPWDGNLRGPVSSAMLSKPKQGPKAVAAALESGTVAAGTYTLPVQIHTALEPHAAVARWTGETLEVWASTQSCALLAEDVAERFDLHHDDVVIRCPYVGGAFGAKVGLQMETLTACLLAREAGAPVGVALAREDELMVGGYRPGCTIAIAIAADAEGQLTGMTYQAVTDSGVSVGTNSAMLARLIYPHKAKELDDFDIVTHRPPARPFRAPGGPAAFFALESAVDDMAKQRGEDPLDLRLRWDPNPRRQRLYRWAQGLDVWKARTQGEPTGRYRKGVGVASGTWYVFWDPHVQVQLEVIQGRITASTACQDMGNGTRSMMAWTVAGMLGLDPDAIDVRLGDSRDVYGCMSAGSRTACSVGPAAMHATEQLQEALVDLGVDQGLRGDVTAEGILPDGGGALVTWAELLEALPTSTFVGRRRRDDERAFLPFATSNTKIGRTLPGSVHLCEVEVDTVLGHVRATKAWVGVTAGKILCPPVARSQMEGAVIQGLSYALYEQRILDHRTGRLLSHNLDDYRIAGIGDMPPIDVHFDEEGYEAVRGGAIGIGEIGTVGVTASVANAVFHATGERPRRLPLTPQRMLEVLA